MLNGHLCPWCNIESGVSQGLIVRPLLFLIYINNLSDSLKANVRIFEDNVSFFCIHNINLSSNNMKSNAKIMLEQTNGK